LTLIINLLLIDQQQPVLSGSYTGNIRTP